MALSLEIFYNLGFAQFYFRARRLWGSFTAVCWNATRTFHFCVFSFRGWNFVLISQRAAVLRGDRLNFGPDSAGFQASTNLS